GTSKDSHSWLLSHRAILEHHARKCRSSDACAYRDPGHDNGTAQLSEICDSMYCIISQYGIRLIIEFFKFDRPESRRSNESKRTGLPPFLVLPGSRKGYF